MLFTVWPYPGHLDPTIAVAGALAARGNDVAFYTADLARARVESHGWRCFPFAGVRSHLAAVVGPHGAGDDDLYRRVMRFQSRPFTGGRARLIRLGSVYARTVLGTVPGQLEDLLPILRSWAPDVIVTDPDLWAPFLVLGEHTGIPVCVLSYYATCLVPSADAPPPGFGVPSAPTVLRRLQWRVLRATTDLVMAGVRARASEIRRAYGLAPLGGRVHELMGRVPLHLVASAREFDPFRGRLPASVHYVGPCVLEPDEPVPPFALERDNGDPLVYASEGTTYVGTPTILHAAARGLAGLPLQVVMSTGDQREAGALGAWADAAPNVTTRRWVPHAAIFRRARVFVTHGGASSVLGALRAGVPLVVVPLQWEQADNAQRAAELGVGIRLDARRCTPARLRAAVCRVLEDPSFRDRAASMARVLNGYGGAPRAADLVEGAAA